MGLDPNYAPDKIQRIKIDAPIVDTQNPDAFTTAPQDQVSKPTRKRKTRKNNDI
jgi:hypothetical protein